MKYVYGTEGSLMMICPRCHREHFRSSSILESGHKEYCVYCGDVELEPMVENEMNDEVE